MSEWIDSYLGQFAAEVTEGQKSDIEDAATRIEAIYPDPDENVERQEALTGAVRLILRDSTLEELGAEWNQAVRRERLAMASLKGAIVAFARWGAPEAEIARRAGVTRVTVRKTLEK